MHLKLAFKNSEIFFQETKYPFSVNFRGHVFYLKTDLRVKIGSKYMTFSCPAKEIQVLKNFYKINFFLNFRFPNNGQCLDHPFLPEFS
jgi:hypothetical protein